MMNQLKSVENRIFYHIVKGVIAMLAMPMLLLANDISMTASVTSETVVLNQPFSYIVQLSGKELPDSSQIQVPDFSSYFQMMGTQQSQSFSFDSRSGTRRSVQYELTLRPQKEGKITIGPSMVEFKGKQYQSNSVQVMVVAGNVPAAMPSSGKSAASSSQSSKEARSIFAQASLDKKEVYVGEQVTYKLELYRRIRLFSEIQHAVPAFTGFLSEPLTVNPNSYVKVFSGKQFHGQEINKTALFPLDAGVKTIDASQIGVVINFFDGQQVLKSPSLKVRVKPLPSRNKPKSFSGAVGQYLLQGALMAHTSAVGEPIVYEITLSGEGNIKAINSLKVADSDTMKIYLSTVKDAVSVSNTVAGKRVFEYIVIPKIPGEQMVPTVSLSYFSPKDHQYHLIKVASKHVSVTGEMVPNMGGGENNTSEIQMVNTDIDYLKPITHLEKEGRYPWQTIWGKIIVFLNGAGLLGSIIWGIKTRLYRPNISKLKSKKAYAMASKSLMEIERSTVTQSEKVTQLYNLVLEYLSNKMETSFHGLTQEEMVVVLKIGGYEANQVSVAMNTINGISEVAYAPGMLTESKQAQLMEQVKEVLVLLEGKSS